MAIIDGILQEFVHESAGTRKTLERLPESELGWKPHPKSMTMGVLACHLAETPSFVEAILKKDELNFKMSEYKPADLKTVKEIVARFDANVAKAKKVMKGVADATLMLPWTLKGDGKVVFSMPRIAALRAMVLNHSVHHRGQLTVYLRLKDVPLPGLYGPSADEQMK
jgi:uncharacterized damage-inducible protein DinB